MIEQLRGEPINHGRAWDGSQERRLVHIVCCNRRTDVQFYADVMGRTCDSITSRMAKMLRLAYYTSNEELIKLFITKFADEDLHMKDPNDPTKGPAKYRVVMEGFTSVSAETMEEAESAAKLRVRGNPTKDAFIFKAVKRVFTPSNMSVEDILE